MGNYGAPRYSLQRFFMTKKRIEELANFFYSSNSATDVPLRVSVATGQFSGHSLDRNGFKELMTILEKSNSLKNDLASFLYGKD